MGLYSRRQILKQIPDEQYNKFQEHQFGKLSTILVQLPALALRIRSQPLHGIYIQHQLDTRLSRIISKKNSKNRTRNKLPCNFISLDNLQQL